jgi:hypothetical protein
MPKKIAFIWILVLSLLGCREKRDFVEDRQVRMEVGYGLEGVFPDAFVGHVERNQMVPFFQANRVGPGIEATVELLVAKALESREEKSYDREESRDPAGDHLSGGAGARVDVAIGSEQGWMLDFASMHRFVGFNHPNQWHFKDLEHPYMFAFHEWRFDTNGFPHPKD